MFAKSIVALVALIASVSAFAPSRTVSAKGGMLKMSASDLPGALAPMGFFDPLGLSSDKTDGEMKKIREAELKHGRVCMVAALGILTGENFNPFFDGKISGPAIYQFQQADDIVPYFWVLVTFAIALVEGQNILSGWENPDDTKARGPGAVAQLRDTYVNGDLGFDPLGLKPADQEEFDTMRTKELQNGRLAMLGVAGMVAQELVTGQSLF